MNDEELALNLYKIYLGLDWEKEYKNPVRFYHDSVKQKWIQMAREIKKAYLPFFVYGGT
jgi:hypothetical protein